MKAMRFSSRFGVAITLISSVFVLSAWLTQGVPSPIIEIDELMDRSHRVLAYDIDFTRSALFKLQPGESSIELISNLHINTQGSVGPEMDFAYALQTTLLDENLNALADRSIWHQTRHSSWVDKESGRLMTSAFYLNENLIPCDSRIFKFQLDSDMRSVQFLRVRLESPVDGSASIRAYRHEDLLKGRELGAVLPLKSRLKAKLARHNLFGHKVKEVELRRFLSDVWQQIPSEGRSGEDYLTRALYLYDHEIPILGEEQALEYQTLQASQPLLMSVVGPGEISITAQRATSVFYSFLSGKCDQNETEVQLDPDVASRMAIPEGKHLASVRSADEQLIVKIEVSPASSIITSDGNPAIEPVQMRSMSFYRSNNDSEVPIWIDIPEMLDDDPPGPVKVLCRKPFAIQQDSAESTLNLHYEFRDVQQKVLGYGTFEGHVYASRFARYDSTNDQINICPSFPERFYLSPPPSTRVLLVWTDDPVDLAFFSCFDRPSAMIQSIESMGDESQELFCVASETDPHWFYFKPFNAIELSQTNRVLTIQLPVDVIEMPVIPAGSSHVAHFRSIHPVDTSDSLLVFDSTVSASETDDDTFSKILKPNTKITIDRTSDTHQSERMSIKYHIVSEQSSEISLFLDGVRKLKFRPLSRTGVFQVTGIQPGVHTLNIQTQSDDDMFWAKAWDEVVVEGDSCKVRRVYPVKNTRVLEIDVEKTSWEPTALNIIVYTSQNNVSDINLTAECHTLPSWKKGRATRQLTIPKRIWNGQAAVSETIRTTSGDYMQKAVQLFFPLQDDVPPGTYRLTLSTDQTDPLFLRFFARSQNE